MMKALLTVIVAMIMFVLLMIGMADAHESDGFKHDDGSVKDVVFMGRNISEGTMIWKCKDGHAYIVIFSHGVLHFKELQED